MAQTYDLAWYASRGKEVALLGRCPYANIHSCPRHFQSVAVLGAEGITTSLPQALDRSLTSKWLMSPLWPAVDEHATAVINGNMFANFCPEVAFDVFHVFGTYLSRHGDEIDRDAAYRAIEREGNPSSADWRWTWSHVTPMHFSECPLHAQLALGVPKSAAVTKPEEIFGMKPAVFGFSLNIKVLLDRLAQWWLAHRRG